MNERSYRLTKQDLLEELSKWGNELTKEVLAVGCGGTALTLYGYKESTKDVDFLIPIPNDHERLSKMLLKWL